jgi:hypothetical protein
MCSKIVCLPFGILTVLKSDALFVSRIHYLKEFDGYVYAATDKGLFKKPVSEFFTPRPEAKNIFHPIIKKVIRDAV